MLLPQKRNSSISKPASSISKCYHSFPLQCKFRIRESNEYPQQLRRKEIISNHLFSFAGEETSRTFTTRTRLAERCEPLRLCPRPPVGWEHARRLLSRVGTRPCGSRPASGAGAAPPAAACGKERVTGQRAGSGGTPCGGPARGRRRRRHSDDGKGGRPGAPCGGAASSRRRAASRGGNGGGGSRVAQLRTDFVSASNFQAS